MAEPKSVQAVRFDVLRNALYHTGKRRQFDRLEKCLNFLVIVLGTSVVSELGQKLFNNTGAQYLGAATAIIGAAQLTFGFAIKAREHEGLQRRYYDVLQRIEAVINPTVEQAVQWQAEMVKITGDEPPTDAVADALAYNDAANSLGYGADALLHVPVWARLIGKILPLRGYRFETRGERAARKKG